jgi:hypothetical protein
MYMKYLEVHNWRPISVQIKSMQNEKSEYTNMI